MNNKTYDLKFGQLYLDLANFKQKQAYILNGCISGGRLHDFMRFKSYAIMSFSDDDEKHSCPHVELIDKFNRTKCNCLVYDLSHNAKNNGKFDLCFIYHINGHSNTYYGYVMYNSETHEESERYLIECLPDVLCIKLTQTFNTMLATHIYDHYKEKSDCVKGRNGKTLHQCPSILDYQKMKESYGERLKTPITWPQYQESYAKAS